VAVIGPGAAVLVDRAAELGEHDDDRVVPVLPQPVRQRRQANCAAVAGKPVGGGAPLSARFISRARSPTSSLRAARPSR
jgi:hypothetical protein